MKKTITHEYFLLMVIRSLRYEWERENNDEIKETPPKKTRDKQINKNKLISTLYGGGKKRDIQQSYTLGWTFWATAVNQVGRDMCRQKVCVPLV